MIKSKRQSWKNYTSIITTGVVNSHCLCCGGQGCTCSCIDRVGR